MFKKLIKRGVSLTPWRIVRAKKSVSPPSRKNDAITHNSQASWDAKFSSSRVLDSYYSPQRERLNQRIIELIMASRTVNDSDVFGDVGCGLGYLLAEARKNFKNVQCFGYDFSITGLEAAQSRCPQAKYEQQDIYNRLPRQHDMTVCSQTLEHLLYPDRAVKNLLLGTREGGIVVLTVPDGRLDQFSGHVQFWSPESWEVWINSVADGRDFSCHRMEGGTAGGANLLAVIQC